MTEAWLRPSKRIWGQRSKPVRKVSLHVNRLFGDSDRDGVPNVFDCRPLNLRKQGDFVQNVLRKKREEREKKINEARRLGYTIGRASGLSPQEAKNVTKRRAFEFKPEQKLPQGAYTKMPPLLKRGDKTREGRRGISAKQVEEEDVEAASRLLGVPQVQGVEEQAEQANQRRKSDLDAARSEIDKIRKFNKPDEDSEEYYTKDLE